MLLLYVERYTFSEYTPWLLYTGMRYRSTSIYFVYQSGCMKESLYFLSLHGSCPRKTAAAARRRSSNSKEEQQGGAARRNSKEEQQGGAAAAGGCVPVSMRENATTDHDDSLNDDEHRAVARFTAAVKASCASISSAKSQHAPVCIVCGGRNAGKSTLARRLLASTVAEANSLRGHAAEPADASTSGTDTGDIIAYIETDCGQPEFSPPGLLGLYLINAQNLDNGGEGGDGEGGAGRQTNRSQRHIVPKTAKFVGALSPKVRSSPVETSSATCMCEEIIARVPTDARRIQDSSTRRRIRPMRTPTSYSLHSSTEPCICSRF